MGRPLVSIVTPVLNRVETIAICLASVARQTYDQIEHIVVDGGSTDGTVDVLRDYHTSHRFHWLSEPDSGMYEAVNRGMAIAKGDVLAYLSSDDLYLPWSVDVAVRELQRGIDLVYGDLGVLRTHANGKPEAFYIQFYPEFDLRYYSFVGTIAQPTVFWRRSVTERIGVFDTGYRLIGDCEYWLRAALGGVQLKHISEVMAIQVDHGSTLRATQPARMREEFDELRRKMRAVADPPSSLRWERFKHSVAWRARQLEFFLAMKSRHPRKWHHLVKDLRVHGIDMTFGDLRMLAPPRWRRGASLLRDAPRISAILGGPERL